MFWLTMGYETHPNDSQQVFVDLFLYTTVVKWTRKNKNVFVYVKCFYVTVGLKRCYGFWYIGQIYYEDRKV